MTDHEPPRPRRRLSFAPALIFPLVGPALVACVFAVPLAIIGLFVLGPGGVLYYLLLFIWWLPGLYLLLGPPFLLAGILLSLAGLVLTPSLVIALAATEFAFAAYFGFWLFMPEGLAAIAPDYANLWAGLRGSPQSILLILAVTAACWSVARKLDNAWRGIVAPSTSARPSPRHLLIGVGAMLAGAAALASVLTMSARLPATAWKDCTEGDYQDRLRGCTVIIERTDESAQRRATAYFRRGSARDELNQDLAGVIADYSEAIRLAPDRADAYAGRGLVYARRGEDEAAISDLDMALKLSGESALPNDYRVFRARGLAHFRRREFDLAIADHSQEIRLQPFYADGYLNRAAANLAKGDADQAVIDYTDAIRVEPFRPEGYIGRGSIYLAKGDADRALTDFDEAIRRRPSFPLTAPAYRKRGLVLETRGDLSAALSAFETALSLDPSDKEARDGRDRTRAALQGQRG